jgi:SAM-dependent methyltransferase
MKSVRDKDTRRLYGDLAWTWPIISPPEDYVDEGEEFRQLVEKYSRIEAKTLLDLGCGGGHNDCTLKRFFDVTGVDLSPEMLALAKELNPEVAYQVGDMRSVRLGRTFDAVIIADSINYMLNEEDLRAAFETAYEHLNFGGVFVTYVEETPEGFEQNKTTFSVRSQSEVEVVFIENYYDPDPDDSWYECTFVYLIRQDGKLDIHTDGHLCGMFPIETWRRLLSETGFELNVRKSGIEPIPTIVCVKPEAAGSKRR